MKSKCLCKSLVLLLLLFASSHVIASSNSYIVFEKKQAAFTLAAEGACAPLYADSSDHSGVIRVLHHLAGDIERVAKIKPMLNLHGSPAGTQIILVGTLGKSALIGQLIEKKKLDVSDIAGKWETFLIQVVDKPFDHVQAALVIAGSDKRGTIFGMYDLAERIGVSPWYWWADVPAPHHSAIYVKSGRFASGEPAVKYRGIFINDEAPALSGWAFEKFGGFNSRFYDNVFELILRLKGNFLWPAMWGRMFYVEDSLNPKLADEYGVVISTSHHEPLMRAHAEWAKFGSGPWNYDKNKTTLQDFWRLGMQRMGDYESIVTIGMRGDGDEPMSEQANIALLESIVRDQRRIISETTGKPAEQTPQVWALYKEVQEYYDKGMRVPDDVTLLLCDDNWGNIRKLPRPGDKLRSGNYGIYYHFDYVGGPRNYKWLNTNQISRIWEQMHLAWEHGVNRIWVVNVGDIKPMEYPISFFLDYAWNPNDWPAQRLPAYGRQWAEQQFGEKYAAEIADILTTYTRYNSRRKPELLAPDTYSLIHYQEAESVVRDYKLLEKKAERIYQNIPSEYKDAYYQLVLHPVMACANLYKLYCTAARNRLHADQGRSSTNMLAAECKKLFARDAEITRAYHTQLARGKWNHMMDQTHIGYTYWQQPDSNSMPAVTEIPVPDNADMGIAVEGVAGWWPMQPGEAILPEFDANTKSRYIEIFNRGQQPFSFSAQPSQTWIVLTPIAGTVDSERRLSVTIDWQQAPRGKHQGIIRIIGNNKQVSVQVAVNNLISQSSKHCFFESNGYVAMEAAHYTKKVDAQNTTWQCIPDLGRTLSGMTLFPTTVQPVTPDKKTPHLQYAVHIEKPGPVQVQAFLSPTLNFYNTQGLRYAISFDDERPQIINMHAGQTLQDWERWVSDNINLCDSRHLLTKPGKHVLKFWLVDPGVVLQKLVVLTEKAKACYLGPPESFNPAIPQPR